MSEDEIDLEARELCPDGACIGVIGEDGRCRACGRTRAEAEAGEPPALEPSEPVREDEAADAADFDQGRELCSDGSCIGVIGEDGRCRECGRPRLDQS